MKKYIIKDKNDIKKTIYAKDLAHALTFVDSKVKDDNYLSTKVITFDIKKVANNIKR